MKTLTLEDRTVTFEEGRHVYTDDKTGLPIRGVTSVLRLLDKPALVQWAANMAVEYIRNHSEEDYDENDGAIRHIIPTGELDLAKTAHRRFAKGAADIGTEVHKFAEMTLRGEEVDLPEDKQARKGCDAFLGWLSEHKPEPIALEQMIFHPDWWYAGTADFYGKIGGELCVLDFKTSSGLYVEHILQIAAYTAALERMYGTRIAGGWVVLLNKKTGKFSAYFIKRSDEDQTAFRHLLELDTHMKRLNEKMKEIKR